jgi:hypothetical protein
MTKQDHHQYAPPSKEEIAVYAFYLWDVEGRQEGRDLEYWLHAEAQLTADRVYKAGLLAASMPAPQSAARPRG